MPNMKTKSQRNLKLLGRQEKTDGRTDELIPVYPPYNFVVRVYNKILEKTDLLQYWPMLEFLGRKAVQ
jgi:hypothetical protein